MSDDLQRAADERLEAAMARTGARDPREFYRTQLKELKTLDADAYARAVSHYREVLLPGIARDGVEPLAAWTEYGRTLAELRVPGRTMSIDASGRAQAYEPPAHPDALVLHLPEKGRGRALLVGLPAKLSSAQRATYDWLVAGRQKLAPGSGADPSSP